MSKQLQPTSANAVTRRAVLQSAALSGLAIALPRVGFAAAPTVETSAGKLLGADNNGVKVFKGVPYGAPPVGKLRFQAPQPAAKWTGAKEALKYGHAAPQGASLLPEQPSRGAGFSLQGEGATFSEDCLYLNVWTPALDNGKRPVLVWLHGGGFSTGSGGSILYDGANMARTQDVVVLTINHRLNVFGYLDLSFAGADYADSSNAGMHDIVLALKWVKENIAAFGGNPANVTLFGESGGGRKVSVMMAFPSAQGLFHRAIVQSGSALRMASRENGAERAQKFLSELQLKPTDIDKLLALPTEALLAPANKAAREFGQFRPTAGTPSLPAHPFDPVAPGMSANVPMMIGTNLTEASFAMGRDPRILALDEAGVIERVKALVPADKAAEVFATYKRIYPNLLPSDILFRVATDRGYFLDSTIQAERKAALGKAPAFLYSFYWEQPLAEGRTHVPHGSEIAFAFNNVQLARGANPEQLAATMCATWAAFARTGDPSNAALGKWTPYNAASRPTMIFDKQCRIENDPRGELRKLMASFGSQQYAAREIAPL